MDVAASETHDGSAKPLWLRVAPAAFLVLWCSGFAFIRIGLAHAGPLTFLALRYAFALAVLVPVALVMRPRVPPRAALGHLAVVGFLIQTVYFGLCYLAVDIGLSAGALALIVSLQPILVALGAPALTGEKTTGRLWLGLVLGLVGAALVIVARSRVEVTSGLALACAVGALLGMSGATLYEKRHGTGEHPVSANLVQYAVGLATTLPFAFAFEGLHVDWAPEFIGALAYLVIANSLISITLLLAMVRAGDAAKVSALFFLVPPGAALIAWALIGEAVPLLAWPGIVLAGVGVLLARR
jgi:drug/metabolite transporter (DMT)-like permease